MYDNGRGTAVDKTKALHWYEKAAEQGDDATQDMCGLLYYFGDGTAADEVKAKMWCEKVAAQTVDEDLQEMAKKRLRELF